jgi:hypothetical protein
MQPPLKLCVGVAALAFSGLAAAQVTLYGRENFRGRAVSAQDSLPNLEGSRLDDRASSVRVDGGTWQLCSEPYFRGECVTVTPGDYPSLRATGLNNAISSAREVSDLAPRPPRYEPRADVVLYDGPAFTGRSIALDGGAGSLDHFNDRARSMVVHEGQWELCEHDRFRGNCVIYGPGRHADLGRLAGDLSSLRPVEAVAAPWPGRTETPTRVVLFDRENFRGRTVAIDDDLLADLSQAGFADRASSLRVEGGSWVFCSNPNFQGQCWTFGPGEYAVLPPSLTDRVSSLRRVPDDYRTDRQPNWSMAR